MRTSGEIICFSVNTSIDGNSFKISVQEAKDIVNKTPAFGPPQPLDPIGKSSGEISCMLSFLHLSFVVDKMYFLTCKCTVKSQL